MEAKEAVKKLKLEFDENKNSHVFLVETNDLDLCLNDIKEIIANFVAKDSPIANMQIKNENYMELIIVRSDGKTIKNENIRELQERLKTKPILSDYLFYIILAAEDMNESSSNKLLKTIEEPNFNTIGFLLTKNSDLLLPTIKSRCETVALLYESDHSKTAALDDELISVVKKMIKAIEKSDHISFYKIKTSSKELKENGQVIENLIKNYYNMACNLKKAEDRDRDIVEFIRENNDYNRLIQKAKYLNETLNKLTKNVNADLLLEKIFFDLKEVK